LGFTWFYIVVLAPNSGTTDSEILITRAPQA